MIPLSEPELHAGLVAGAAAALVVLAVAAFRRPAPGSTSPTVQTWPYGGMVFVVAGLAVIRVVEPLQWEVLLGVVGVTAAVDGLAAARQPRWAQAAAALPFALLIATGDALPRVTWFQVLVALAIAGGGVLVGATDDAWGDVAAAPVLLAIALGGTYAAVPDTEHVLALLGVALLLAAVAFPWPLARLGDGGAAGATALVVWACAYDSRGRPAALIGAVTCLGLLLALPVGARLRAGMSSVLEDFGPRSRVIVLAVVQVAVALFAARTSGLQSSAVRALAFALPSATIALALSTVLQPPRGPDHPATNPHLPLRSEEPGPADPGAEGPSRPALRRSPHADT